MPLGKIMPRAAVSCGEGKGAIQRWQGCGCGVVMHVEQATTAAAVGSPADNPERRSAFPAGVGSQARRASLRHRMNRPAQRQLA
jgi:hypothetical protein